MPGFLSQSQETPTFSRSKETRRADNRSEADTYKNADEKSPTRYDNPKILARKKDSGAGEKRCTPGNLTGKKNWKKRTPLTAEKAPTQRYQLRRVPRVTQS